MIEHQIQVRVRYAETDQMGFVYYGNYATYFEVARVETFRNIGFSYKKMEELGVLMPVLTLNTRFIKPAKYDDLLTIKVFVREKPGLKIKFEYEIYNEEDILLNKSETILVFLNKESGRPALPGPVFQEIFDHHFE